MASSASPGEIITLQFGGAANHAGAHWWNLQVCACAGAVTKEERGARSLVRPPSPSQPACGSLSPFHPHTPHRTSSSAWRRAPRMRPTAWLPPPLTRPCCGRRGGRCVFLWRGGRDAANPSPSRPRSRSPPSPHPRRQLTPPCPRRPLPPASSSSRSGKAWAAAWAPAARAAAARRPWPRPPPGEEASHVQSHRLFSPHPGQPPWPTRPPRPPPPPPPTSPLPRPPCPWTAASPPGPTF